MIKVFVSYAHEDFEHAKNLKEELDRAEFKALRDNDFISTGDDWRRAIDNAISNCNAFLVIATEASMASKYVQYECGFAFGKGCPVLAIKFEDCELHPRLDVNQYAEFFNPKTSDWQKLSDEVRKRVLIDHLLKNNLTWKDFELVRDHVDESYTEDLLRRFISEDPLRFALHKYNAVSPLLGTFDAIKFVGDKAAF